MKAYKFSECAKEKPEILNGQTPQEFLKSKYVRGSIFGLDGLQSSGVYRYMGWAFNFRPYLKRFVVKQYGSWQEYYAPNKTALRNSLFGRIEEISEL